MYLVLLQCSLPRIFVPTEITIKVHEVHKFEYLAYISGILYVSLPSRYIRYTKVQPVMGSKLVSVEATNENEAVIDSRKVPEAVPE